MYNRLISERLKKSNKNVLLLGPRQVGKSTLCRSLNPSLIINLADERNYLRYSKDPDLLFRELAAQEKSALILIDEIQRIPSLLNSIQSVIDSGTSHRFLLTGSSARKLKKGGANLLPGRILLEHLDPLTIWELSAEFNLDRALSVGTLPGVYLDVKEGEDILESYANTYLREEVQAEALIKNIGSYARFLDIAAESSGAWMNYSKLASDSEISKETIRRYFTVLEETLLAFRLPSFQPRSGTRRVSQKDRFIFFDLGVRNALLGLHKSAQSNQEKGFLFEQWFIQQCIYYSRANRKNWKFSSYRTEHGAEVDLVLDLGTQLIGIECKYGKNVGEADLKGLRSLEEVSHKPIKKYLVYRGETRQKFSKKEVVFPYSEFLLQILPTL